MFQNDPFKTVRGVDYANFIHYNAKSCLKWLSSKGGNSVKIKSSSTKNPQAHFQYVHNRYARFQKDPLKTVGEVDYTKCTVKRDEWMDRQMDRLMDGQGQILMPSDYCHGSIKN